ncbi:uncharacterized protein CEXT_80091 [Caerostris extrusa]|uniref:Uncharacterized protein n=1 Tax=Caerostris extrusa TaxID=172846 RepID=A0AAV4T0R8_CAEEX|nr:uncharacterized protein CEXT_80091 [Caerostris extrusa]
MQDDLQDVSNNLAGKSQVALDVTKWKVQDTLKDMKLKMQRITQGFEVKDDLARCIEKLEEAMVTQINIYDRIQNFEDQQYFTNLIADISSATANSIHITDPSLASEVDLVRLEMLIRSNIVLKEYKIALDAFKQWVFPFAHHYIDESMIHLQLDGDVENLVFNAVTIRSLVVKAAIVQDSYCKTLFSGHEVVLKADLRKSAANKDAIKFRAIEFHFKSDNETVQSQVNEALKKFDITATHMGNSYYSPYAVWKIQLHKTTGASSYRDLEVFRGKVDLELEGNGSYVAKDVGSVDDEYQILEELDVNEEIHTYNLPNFRHVDMLNHDESKIGYVTSGAEPTLSSPINYVCNLVKMHTTSIIMSSLCQISMIGREIPRLCKANVGHIEIDKKSSIIKSSLNQISVIDREMSGLDRNNTNHIEIDEKSIIKASLYQISRIDREMPRHFNTNANRTEIDKKSSIIKSSLYQISIIDRETSELRINDVNPIEINEKSIIKSSLYQISIIDRETSELRINDVNPIEINEKSIIKSSLYQISIIPRETSELNRNNTNRIELSEKSPETEDYNMIRKPIKTLLLTTLNANSKNGDQNTVTNNSTIENQTTTNSSISFKKDNAINDCVLVDAFSDNYNNHSNLFLLSEKEVTFNKKMIESLELNYSLLLADLITRSLTNTNHQLMNPYYHHKK